jgi:hypothetical protein
MEVSFDCKMVEQADGTVMLDQDYFANRLEQCKHWIWSNCLLYSLG